MAVYKVNNYKDGFYGGSDQLVSFDASPFTALAVDVGYTHLSWVRPAGNWSRFRLVRNAHGWPVHEGDGVVLLDLNSGPSATGTKDAPVEFYDDTLLGHNRFYYYSIFVYGIGLTDSGGDDWRRAGDVTVLSIGDKNYTERMLELLPEPFWVDVEDESGRNNQFIRFLDLFAFQLGHIREQYDSLRDLWNPDKVAAALLQPLGQMFRVDYEPEVGIPQMRAMVRNAVYIHKRKGTRRGTEALITSFTGWDCQARTGKNLMLDYNESSFEEGIGHWEGVGNTTPRWRFSDNVVAAWQSSSFVNKQNGMLLLTSAAAGNIGAALAYRDPMRRGIPVTAGTTYTFSAYVRPFTTARLCWATIRWFGPYGAVLSTTTGATATSVVGSWTRRTVTATAPAGAVYAGVSVNMGGALAGEQHAVDAAQFEVGGSATAFEEARDIRMILVADRVNEVPNPSAELDLTAWGAPAATLLSRDTTVAFTGDPNSTTPANTAGAPNLASFLIEPALPANNLLANPSFEGASALNDMGSINANVIDISATESLIGNQSLHAITDSSSLVQGLVIRPPVGTSLPANTTCRAAVWVKGTPGVSCTVAGRTLDPATNTTYTQGLSPVTFTLSSGWQQVKCGQFTNSTQAFRPGLQVAVAAPAAAVDIYADVAQIEAASNTTVWPASSGQAYTSMGSADKWMAVQAGESYTASAWVYGPADCRPALSFYDASFALIAGSSTNGALFPSAVGTWQRVSVTAIAPEGAAFGILVLNAPWLGTASLRLWFDQVLYERTATLQPYFDATQSGTRPSDMLWQGTAHASRSHYYFNRTAKGYRLDALLDDYLLPGTTRTMLYAQPDIPAIYVDATEDPIDAGVVGLTATASLSSP